MSWEGVTFGTVIAAARGLLFGLHMLGQQAVQAACVLWIQDPTQVTVYCILLQALKACLLHWMQNELSNPHIPVHSPGHT